MKRIINRIAEWINKYFFFFKLSYQLKKINVSSNNLVVFKLNRDYIADFKTVQYIHKVLSEYMNEHFKDAKILIVLDEDIELYTMEIYPDDVFIVNLQNDVFSLFKTDSKLYDEYYDEFKKKLEDNGFDNKLLLQPDKITYNTIEKKILREKLNEK